VVAAMVPLTYAGVLALWPLVLDWWPWLLAGAIAVVALGAWWLWARRFK
jgi:hypothetical protein